MLSVIGIAGVFFLFIASLRIIGFMLLIVAQMPKLQA